MADILIRGMEMPKSCVECLFNDDENTFCRALSKYVPAFGEPPAKCPLVPLPEKHGRLIDADAFEDAFIRYYLNQERRGHLMFAAVEIKQQLADMIGDWPTIIEAEGGGEDGR